jgi:hypothetical protein
MESGTINGALLQRVTELQKAKGAMYRKSRTPHGTSNLKKNYGVDNKLQSLC